MKLVINTNIHYSKPLDILLSSLRSINFPFNDIIIVISECDKDETPRISNEGVTEIYTTQNVFEYTAFNIIKQYIDSVTVSSDAYMFIHDTCTVDNTFLEKFNMNKNKCNINDILAPYKPCSNIIICHNNVLRKMNKFPKLDKGQAVDLEFARHVFINGIHIKSVYDYGNVHTLDKRIRQNSIDIYNTGYKRTVVYYPCYGLYKYFLHGLHGDFHNDVKLIKNSKALRS